MTPSFSFDIDPTRDFVRVALAGFFQPDDVLRFQQARDLAYQRLTCPPRQHVTLVDIRGMHIQSQDAVAAFGKLLANPSHTSKALAIVVSRSLARMQIQRVATGLNVSYLTDDLEAAERWLMTIAPSSSLLQSP